MTSASTFLRQCADAETSVTSRDQRWEMILGLYRGGLIRFEGHGRRVAHTRAGFVALGAADRQAEAA